MRDRIAYFEGWTSGHLLLAGDEPERRPFHRELWFDRDIDGRWLVGVADPTDATEDSRIGAIVVKDPAASQFIQLLGELLFDPDTFADEPVFDGTDLIGQSDT